MLHTPSWPRWVVAPLCIVLSGQALAAGAPGRSDDAVERQPAAAQPGSRTQAPPADAQWESAAPDAAQPAEQAPAGPTRAAPPPQAAPGQPPGFGYPAPYFQPVIMDPRPLTLEYDPSKPIPQGYELESRPRKGFVIAGAIVFGIGYGISALVGSLDESETGLDNTWMFVPVVGPLIAAATGDKVCHQDYSYTSEGTVEHCENPSSRNEALALLAGMQGLGAAFLIIGLAVRTQRLVRSQTVPVTFTPAPVGQSGYGLAAIGSF